MKTTDLQARKSLITMLGSYAPVLNAIGAAARFGLPDLLAAGPPKVEALSAAAGCQPEMLQRMLRVLAGEGIFAREADGRWRNTPLSQALRKDVAGSLRGYALMQSLPLFSRTYESLGDSVRSGKPSFPLAFGKSFFEYLGADAETRQVFADSMSSLSSAFLDETLAVYDFTRCRRIADIGGGHGTFLRGILDRSPGSTGVLFDLPETIEAVKAAQPQAPNPRLELQAGDFFQSAPQGCDLYVLRHIIHDWSDAESVAILSACRREMAPHARLLVVEMLLPEAENQRDYSRFMDMAMLAFLSGRERTLTEYSALFDAAGLRLSEAIATSGLFTVLEAAVAPD